MGEYISVNRNDRKPRLKYAHLLHGRGLEIGAFTHPMPVPDDASVLYSDIYMPDEMVTRYPDAVRPDITSDSERFPDINDDTFDFIVANHVLEHLTDPIRALTEWHRILKSNGIILISVPDKRYTFDSPRRRTRLSHLLKDYIHPDPPHEKNLPHLKDWATHVEGLKPDSPEWKTWIDRQLISTYVVHNHVWTSQDIILLILYLYTRPSSRFQLYRWSNTGIFGDEFILVLKSRKTSGMVVKIFDLTKLSAALLSAWIQNPLQIIQAALKRRYRQSRPGR